MNILAFNPGSNSLKFALVAVNESARDQVTGKKIVDGVVEPMTGKPKITVNGRSEAPPRPLKSHGDAANAVFDHLGSDHSIDRIACRVVHGGYCFHAPRRVNDAVLEQIEQLEELAPLHNKSAVSIIHAVRSRMKDVPLIAVWDSGFHETIPEFAWRYALPPETGDPLHIRRYGFHGISHQYMMLRYAAISGRPLGSLNLITLHLEGGSSACAIRNGKSFDTSMGFTPLEGLVMGTRSGDIDPSVIAYLARKRNESPEDVERFLNRECGLLGLSGISQDTRDLVRQIDNPRARMAIEIFCYRARKYIGAYLAAMGGAEAVVFGGGISENTIEVRAGICQGLECIGLRLDFARNVNTVNREGRISTDHSTLQAWVIPSEEELMIAHEAMKV